MADVGSVAATASASVAAVDGSTAAGAPRGGEPAGAMARMGWLRRRWPALALLLLVLGAAALHLYHLGHEAFAPWDEAVHAVVALHMMDSPTTPILYELSALPPRTLASWDATHIWLHILPFGMSAAAMSMKLLGATPFAMRLPGVIFVLLGMVATYRLGRRLFAGTLPALTGAFFIGYAPLVLSIGQGYSFGDMTDTPVVGLSPVVVLAAVKGWQTGRRRWLVLAGIVQWVLFLSKSGLGLATCAVVVALFVADLWYPREDGWRRPGVTGLVAFLGTTLALVGSAYLYFAHRFPATTSLESRGWRRALFSNYEGWGAPVDTHLTFYLYLMYGSALAVLLVVAVLACGYHALVRRRRAELVVVVWFAVLYLPLTIAVTKAPPYTVGAVGASGLIVGRFIQLVLRSTQRRWRAIGLGVLASAAAFGLVRTLWGDFGVATLSWDLSPRRPLVAMSVHQFLPRGRGLPYLILGALTLVFAALYLLVSSRRIADPLRALARRALSQRPLPQWLTPCGLAVAAAVVVCAGYVVHMDARYARSASVAPGPAPAVGRYLAEHSPPDATIFMDVSTGVTLHHTNLMVMFWSHRDAYEIESADQKVVCPLVPKAAAVASTPVLVTMHTYTGPGSQIGSVDGWTVYLLNSCG